MVHSYAPIDSQDQMVAGNDLKGAQKTGIRLENIYFHLLTFAFAKR